jgi:hypothetical protein
MTKILLSVLPAPAGETISGSWRVTQAKLLNELDGLNDIPTFLPCQAILTLSLLPIRFIISGRHASDMENSSEEGGRWPVISGR